MIISHVKSISQQNGHIGQLYQLLGQGLASLWFDGINEFVVLIAQFKILLYLSTMLSSRLTSLLCSASRHIIKRRSFVTAFSTPCVASQTFGLNTTALRYCFSAQQAADEEVVGKDFSEYVTDKEILSKLKRNGITKMFPVQEETFKHIEAGFDILASDRTGSGKTLGYTLPVLEKFNKLSYNLTPIKTPKFLILCPTRELVIQVTNQINKVNSTYKVVSVYGGSSIDRQISDINRGIAIVVATPGRLIDLLEREALNLKNIQVVCIDQADTMLEKGFKDDVEEIFRHVRKATQKKTQNIMFSATIPTWVNKIAREYFDKNMKRVNMVKDQDVRTSQTVDHYALYVKRSERHKTVQNLIEKYNPNQRTIIFTQMKSEANDFIKQFQTNQIAILHGDIPQNVREHNMNQFRNGDKKILIATDIAARGIDIPDVQLIIQLSPPENPETYIHRSGRTGRAGKEGVNITFFDQTNIRELIDVQRAANINIKLISDNHNITFWKNKLKALVHKVSEFKQSTNDEIYTKFIEDILKKTTAQKALKYFLKETIGRLPETTSILTQKKGFISYIAYPKEGTNTKLSDIFPEISINNQFKDQQGIKFDISASDFYQFQEKIDKQDDFEVETLDENKNMTLSMFASRNFRKGASSQYDNGRNNKNFGRRDNNSGRPDRYENNRPQRYQRQEREDRPQRQERQERPQRNSRPESTEIPEGLSVYRAFLFGFPHQIRDREMKEMITAQTQLSNFKLRVMKKTDDNGNVIKNFGFIEFQDRGDCVKFMSAEIDLNGSILKKRIADDRQRN